MPGRVKKLWDDVQVFVLEVGEKPPEIVGGSGWGEERDVLVLDPENFESGAEVQVSNPTHIARDSHSYIVKVVKVGVSDSKRRVFGVFDIMGFHSTDSANPEEYQTRELYIIVKPTHEFEEKERQTLLQYIESFLQSL